MADQSGGATGYQTLINAALREYLNGKAPQFEETLRRYPEISLAGRPVAAEAEAVHHAELEVLPIAA